MSMWFFKWSSQDRSENMGVKCFHMTVDGYRQIKAKVSKDWWLQPCRRNMEKKTIADGFHLKTKCAQCKKIEMKWKTEWHRQFWHGERAAQEQKNAIFTMLWRQHNCLCVLRQHKKNRLLCKERLTNAHIITEGIVSWKCFLLNKELVSQQYNCTN